MSKSDFQFNDQFGNPVPEWANKLLNENIKPKRRKEYNILIHRIERLFENWNREMCPHCGTAAGTDVAGSWKVGNEMFKISQGCCCYCAENFGYLTFRDFVRLIKAGCGFNKTHGFFNEKTGCTLPRHLRSKICQTYCCNKTLSNEARNLWWRIYVPIH